MIMISLRNNFVNRNQNNFYFTPLFESVMIREYEFIPFINESR